MSLILCFWWFFNQEFEHLLPKFLAHQDQRRSCNRVLFWLSGARHTFLTIAFLMEATAAGFEAPVLLTGIDTPVLVHVCPVTFGQIKNPAWPVLGCRCRRANVWRSMRRFTVKQWERVNHQACCCNSGGAGDKVPGTLPDARMKGAKQKSKSPRTDPYRGSRWRALLLSHRAARADVTWRGESKQKECPLVF